MVIKLKKTKKPWGHFEQFNHNAQCTVKLLHVNAGERLSLQYHEKRREFWKVIRGPAQVQIGSKKFVGKEGDEFEIPTKAKHRLSALDSDILILEISYGKFDEDDIVRVEDDFGRAKEVLYA